MERNRYTGAEERILAWLERADFTGQGCWHSQDTIARATGCCRRTVIRSIAKLEADGRIHVQRFARGSRRPNVYRVASWNPHKRAGVLNVLAAIRDAKRAECHSKRTASSSRAQTPRSTPSLTASGGTSAVVARREKHENGLRRTCMEQPRRRHLHVADITCLHCAEKDAEIARKGEIIQDLSRELNRAMEDLAGSRVAAEAAGKAAIAAKAQRTRQAKAEARMEQIEQIVAHWRLLRPRTGPTFGEPGSKSFDMIEKAVKLMAKDPAGPVVACCESIDAVHLAPWWAYGKRYATPGKGRVLKRDLEHALKDEQVIAKNRRALRWLRGGGVQRAWEIYRAVQETEAVYRAEVLDLLGEQRFRREPSPEYPEVMIVDGLIVRER